MEKRDCDFYSKGVCDYHGGTFSGLIDCDDLPNCQFKKESNTMKDFDEVEKELYEQIMGETAAAYEMAMERDDAIKRCLGLGRKFIAHFHKIFTMKKKSYIHHCKEMQAYLDEINSFYLKPKTKPLSITNKYDWFFTAGSTPEYFLKEEGEVEAYEKFVVQLQANPSLKVVEALKEYNK